jgi:peptidoglycan/LPS O-acetylase OafA/YrhL
MLASGLDLAWLLLRAAAALALPALALVLWLRHPAWRHALRLAALALGPCLITLWFLHDGGLANGLNRLAYYTVMALFFAAYTALAGTALLVQRMRGRPRQGLGQALSLGALALMAWVCGAAAFENLA